MDVYKQALIILASFVLVFVWEIGPLAAYTVPAIGFLVFLFLLISIRNKKDLTLGGPLNFFILNSVLLLFIFSTGGISSNLFFILYFLLFGAAFIMDPRVVFIYPIGTIVVFYSQLFEGDVTANLIKAGSLILLTPLAYFFGKQFFHNQKKDDEILKTKERARSAADEISEDVGEVVNTAGHKLSPNEVQKLNDVLEEAQDLRNEK